MRNIILSLLFINTSLQAAPPDFKELSERTYGVHLTQVYPQEGRLMIPGSLTSIEFSPKSVQKSNASASADSIEPSPALTLEQRITLANHTPKYRFTLHWALSGLPEDHDFVTADNETRSTNRLTRPFAIVEPFAQLLPESYGGTDQDWMTIGPHVLSKDSILFAADTHSEQTYNFPGQVIIFNPQKQSLNDLIPAFLKERGAFVLKRDIPVSEYATKSEVQATGYNENNIPVTVNENNHYTSPREFYTALITKGYYWGKHSGTYFDKFEKLLNPFFKRIFIFQGKQLFPEIFENVSQYGFEFNGDPIAYTIDSADDFKRFIEGTQLSEKTQKVFGLWLMEIQIWAKHVCGKDDMTAVKFLSSESDPAGHMKKVLNTVEQLCTAKIHNLLIEVDAVPRP